MTVHKEEQSSHRMEHSNKYTSRYTAVDKQYNKQNEHTIIPGQALLIFMYSSMSPVRLIRLPLLFIEQRQRVFIYLLMKFKSSEYTCLFKELPVLHALFIILILPSCQGQCRVQAFCTSSFAVLAKQQQVTNTKAITNHEIWINAEK